MYSSSSGSWLSKWLLQTLLFCFLYLSTLATSASLVTHLPGFQGPLPFSLETGYITVDEENGGEMFYYFIESEGNPSEDPLLVWLPGGERCTAFHCLAFQIGPLEFVKQPYNGSIPQLVYNQYSWSKVANMLFIDSPVGAGFSYSSNPKGYDIDDIIACQQVHTFITKWIEEHTQYLMNDLYVGGQSYAGQLTPFVAELIARGIEAGINPHLNFKGYLVGNPGTGELYDYEYSATFAHGMGIISDQLYELTQKNCEGEDYKTPSNKLCSDALAAVDNAQSETNAIHVLEPVCHEESKSTSTSTYMVENRRILSEEEQLGLLEPTEYTSFKCRADTYSLQVYWANNNLAREALHITKGTVEEWVRCKKGLPFAHDLPGMTRYHRNVTIRGYRALVYSGDHDRVVPFLGTQAWVRSLEFSIVDDWRAWHVSGQAAGFTITYSNNLTFVTLKGAGHVAPEYKPKESLAMVKRWLFHQPL
ncbi:hypothetical protein LUZ60_006175 [Juncus effusus]|nr:hypothetical protein LUZ60_006175 [Juncus effusus]